jgi:deazaflavin-dependent oxidoreductase (nitroreductase family)
MAWRLPSDAFKAAGVVGAHAAPGSKAALHAIVDGGRIPGLLAYDDGTPVGWCSVAPREEFVALESSRTLARIDDRPVWSVVCFYIDREFQRNGVGTALLEAAVDHARANGATIVEGYPSEPGDRDPFTGFDAMFAHAGFEQVKAAGGGRSGGVMLSGTFAGWFTQHLFNPFVGWLTSLGISVYGSRVLAVRGRSSGQWRTNPVNLLDYNGARYLVAPRGVTQWVKNIRAGGQAELRLGKRVEPIHVTEIADADKLDILRAYLKKWAWEVGAFFDGVGADAPESELRRIAPNHPIFRIDRSCLNATG